MIVLIAIDLWQNETMRSVSPLPVNTSVWSMLIRTTLHSVNPDGNRFRFFIVELWVPPVGGGAALRKRWGRIGTEGRSDILYFDSPVGAEHYMRTLLRRREKRGYVEAASSPWRLLALEAEAESRLRRIRKRLGASREHVRARRQVRDQLALDLTG